MDAVQNGPVYLNAILLTAIGFLIVLGIRLLLAKMNHFGSTQEKQGESITKMEVTLLGAEGSGGLVSRVNSLHEWRNRKQEEDLAAAKDEIRRIRDSERSAS